MARSCGLRVRFTRPKAHQAQAGAGLSKRKWLGKLCHLLSPGVVAFPSALAASCPPPLNYKTLIWLATSSGAKNTRIHTYIYIYIYTHIYIYIYIYILCTCRVLAHRLGSFRFARAHFAGLRFGFHVMGASFMRFVSSGITQRFGSVQFVPAWSSDLAAVILPVVLR